jgi:hypothetical protein
MDEKQLVSVLTNFKEEIISAFDHRIGLLEDDLQHKLDLVVEGQQMLVERMDRIEETLDGVEQKVTFLDVKVDALSSDMRHHRIDEAAHDGVYRVKESS